MIALSIAGRYKLGQTRLPSGGFQGDCGISHYFDVEHMQKIKSTVSSYRITNGENAVNGSYPWLALLGQYNIKFPNGIEFICGKKKFLEFHCHIEK